MVLQVDDTGCRGVLSSGLKFCKSFLQGLGSLFWVWAGVGLAFRIRFSVVGFQARSFGVCFRRKDLELGLTSQKIQQELKEKNNKMLP